MTMAEEKIKAVIRARRAASTTLLDALRAFTPTNFSEADLARQWVDEIKENSIVRRCGWYMPPPHGMSVLIGSPPDYNRLRYDSLREAKNWPSSQVRFSDNCILYPYFSAVDRETLLIGDFVGTFYGGQDSAIRAWVATAYELTMQIADFVQPGQRLSEIFQYAQGAFESLGATNNTYSQSGGLASDIGHTIPGFSRDTATLLSQGIDLADTDVASLLAGARLFVSKDNDSILEEDFGLTIEPQLTAPGLPMASFHVIVAAANGQKTLVTEFDPLFEHFGMNELVSA